MVAGCYKWIQLLKPRGLGDRENAVATWRQTEKKITREDFLVAIEILRYSGQSPQCSLSFRYYFLASLQAHWCIFQFNRASCL